jgi:hypothetical protein
VNDPTLDALGRRQAVITAALAERLAQREGALAAIEVVPEDSGQRDEDLRLIRDLLDRGVSPVALGHVLITVVTNFAYEVDWKDQFSFWPKMHEHLRCRTFDPRESASKRAIADAFQVFSAGRECVAPVGELARHYPLMSWPLIHSVMPWCAQRHIARVLERAAAEGAIPDDPASPWPSGTVEAIAESMGLPVFVMGIIQNPTVLDRVGRALLGDDLNPSVAAWIKRLRRSASRDAVTRTLVAGAKESRQERASGRGGRAPGLPVTLLLQLGVGETAEASLWASIGPYGRAVGTNQEVMSFARSGAALAVRVDGSDAGRVPLFNAIAAPALMEVTWKTAALQVQPAARSFDPDGEIPEALSRAEAGSARTFELPVALRDDGASRYTLTVGRVSVGERIAVLALRTSTLVDVLKARGFAPRIVRRSPQLVALVGTATEALSEDLSAAHVVVETRAPALVPALIPALRRDGERLVFRAGRDVWLRLIDAPVGVALRSEISVEGGSEAAEVGEDDSGSILIRVGANKLRRGVNQLRVFAEGRARALASVELVIEASLPDQTAARWRVVLHPTDAAAEHLRASQCWLDIESLPEVGVEVEVRVGAHARSRSFDPEERGLLETARWLREVSKELFELELEADAKVEVRARATDEPESWVAVATLNRSEGPLRFDLTARSPSIVAADDVPSLSRLEFGASGLEQHPVSQEALNASGIYLAAAGASRAALCVCNELRRLPRFFRSQRFERSVDRSLDLLTTLRAVDVAALWPESGRGGGSLMRRAAARAIERELVGTLCGHAWVTMEDVLGGADGDLDDMVPRIADALWIDVDWLREQVEDLESSLDLLPDLLEKIDERPDVAEARHLTLAFYRRGMTTAGQDEAAIRWAWSGARRARAARACYLLDPDALADRVEGADDGDE